MGIDKAEVGRILNMRLSLFPLFKHQWKGGLCWYKLKTLLLSCNEPESLHCLQVVVTWGLGKPLLLLLFMLGVCVCPAVCVYVYVIQEWRYLYRYLADWVQLSLFNDCNRCKVMFMYSQPWVKDGLCIFEKYLRSVGFQKLKMTKFRHLK